MMRTSCGSNDHPDSILFIQLFKLISTYSLVKPPKGSNINGGEMLETLMNLDDITKVGAEEPQQIWEETLNNILDKGTQNDCLVDTRVIENDPKSSDFIIAYMAGYVRKKSKRFSKCVECDTTLSGIRSRSFYRPAYSYKIQRIPFNRKC